MTIDIFSKPSTKLILDLTGKQNISDLNPSENLAMYEISYAKEAANKGNNALAQSHVDNANTFLSGKTPVSYLAPQPKYTGPTGSGFMSEGTLVPTKTPEQIAVIKADIAKNQKLRLLNVVIGYLQFSGSSGNDLRALGIDQSVIDEAKFGRGKNVINANRPENFAAYLNQKYGTAIKLDLTNIMTGNLGLPPGTKISREDMWKWQTISANSRKNMFDAYFTAKEIAEPGYYRPLNWASGWSTDTSWMKDDWNNTSLISKTGTTTTVFSGYHKVASAAPNNRARKHYRKSPKSSASGLG